VLSAGDFSDRVKALPNLLLAWPGEGRSTGIRLILVFASIVQTVPLGMMLAVGKPKPSLPRVAATGLMAMLAVMVATMFVMSTTPNFGSTVYRTIGVVIGAAAMTPLSHLDYGRLRLLLARLVPFVWIPYVLSVLFINDLLSGPWRTIDEALAAFDYRGLLPLWHFYIVTKAHAMGSLIVHLVTFAPIGVMISLRTDNRSNNAQRAAVIAFLFSFMIEVGRGLKPGFQPDFNDAMIAAASAWLAVKAMPLVWQMAESLPSSNRPLKIPGHAMNRRVG
jgi:hypothetical protein